MRTKRELKIHYDGLICASCKHPIIWQADDRKGKKREVLKHINYKQYGTTEIITISIDCYCGCMEARD